MFQYPQEVAEAVQNTYANIEVSEIRSQKLFDLWVKFAEKSGYHSLNANSWWDEPSECKPGDIHSPKTSVKYNMTNSFIKPIRKANNSDAHKFRQFWFSCENTENSWKQKYFYHEKIKLKF